MKEAEGEEGEETIDITAIHDAAAALKSAEHAVAFTGAGISVDSGIGTFRGDAGLWTAVDPFLFSITHFQRDPESSWRLQRQYLFSPCWNADPCEAHKVLARLEQRGIIKAIITQNIDNLHHRAGSQKVIEVHGNIREGICPTCRAIYPMNKEDTAPSCKRCRCILKPNCTLFGEGLPREAWKAAVDQLNRADIVLVVGTSGEVMPASNLPGLARCHGGKIINLNPTKSNYENIAAISIRMGASKALKVIEEEIEDEMLDRNV